MPAVKRRRPRPSSDAEARGELNRRVRFLNEDFSAFELTTVQLGGKSITGCGFQDSDLRSATLDRSSVRSCDFSAANLQNASFRRTRFTGCTFRGADLRWADLTHASFGKQNTGTGRGACDLGGAQLEGARLSKVAYDSSTIWPEGFDPRAAGAIPVE